MDEYPKPPFEEQQQTAPGLESELQPVADHGENSYKGSGKLEGRKAIITGGDSGIGRAVAIAFAREGADVAICHLEEELSDAQETAQRIQEIGRTALLLNGDLADAETCRGFVSDTLKEFGKLNILINNAAVQFPEKSVVDITDEHLEETFAVNILAMFRITRAAIPHMKEGSCIINTTSITAYQGSPELLDYSATKGAIVAFTRSLAKNLHEKKIRVNGVAPGPIWTPLIPASFAPEKTEKHGAQAPMERPGQPVEVAPSYLFLASKASTYMSGQILHPNGGTVVNG